jgi:hypothetical protein
MMNDGGLAPHFAPLPCILTVFGSFDFAFILDSSRVAYGAFCAPIHHSDHATCRGSGQAVLEQRKNRPFE